MKFLATLFSLFDKLLAYINTQQLKKAGKDELRVEQNEADRKAADKTDEIIKNNSVLSLADKRDKLRKLRDSK